MNARRLFLPALALAGAAILLVPDSAGFSKIGGALTLNQRDFRVFDNFADLGANNNTTPHASHSVFAASLTDCMYSKLSPHFSQRYS